jgi:hypothetical protein
MVFLALVGIPVIGALIPGLYLTYMVTHPGAVPEVANPSNYLLSSKEVSWSLKDSSDVSAWWIPGNKGAAGILLAPGTGLGRSHGLSLAAQLNRFGFNVLLCDSRGNGAAPRGPSTLGVKEVDDVASALNFIRSRPEVDAKRLGIWGTDVSAHAALVVAGTMPEVRAIAADSPFDSVGEFFAARLREVMGHDSGLAKTVCERLFRILNFLPEGSLREGINTAAIADRGVLFVTGDNRKDLAGLTGSLFSRLQPQKERINLSHARVRLMTGEETNIYDLQVANFFRLNLQ